KAITSTIGSSIHACLVYSRSDCAWPKRPAGCLTSRRRRRVLAANHPRRPGAKHPDRAGRAERVERGRYEYGQLLTRREPPPCTRLGWSLIRQALFRLTLDLAPECKILL